MNTTYKFPKSLNPNIETMFTELMEQISINYKNKHKFNLRMRHVIKTSFIAEEIAEEIFEDEPNIIRDITLAGLFHDLGKILKVKDIYLNNIFDEQVVSEDSDGHDIFGAAMVKETLTSFKKIININDESIERVYNMVRNHSSKSNMNLDLPSRIVIEADTLSKINIEAIDDIIPVCRDVKDDLSEFMDKIVKLKPTIVTETGIRLYEENIDIFKNYIKNIIR